MDYIKLSASISISSFISSISSAGGHECPETNLACDLFRLCRLPAANQRQHVSHGGWSAILWTRYNRKLRGSKLHVVNETLLQQNNMLHCLPLRLLHHVWDQLPRLWLPHRGGGQVPGGSRIHLAWHLLRVCGRSRRQFHSQQQQGLDLEIWKSNLVRFITRLCMSSALSTGVLHCSGRSAVLLQKRQGVVQEARPLCLTCPHEYECAGARVSVYSSIYVSHMLKYFQNLNWSVSLRITLGQRFHCKL